MDIQSTAAEGGVPTVAQLAIDHPGALSVFTRYNIDYCCGGHRSLEEACMRMGLDPVKIQSEIQEAPAGVQVLRPETWGSAFLTDFIVQQHHAFVRKAIPELEALLERVCERHGQDTPALLPIRNAFMELAEELTLHMEKEELILFPTIKRLENPEPDYHHPLGRMLQAPIAAMEDEHKAAGNLIRQIRLLSDNYTPPEFACPTFRITFQRLREFDEDLMRHIHLENNILFERFKQAWV
ncbi:iron-sulfur cluster repair di-iron protein [Parachryseolinea silvisoli]|jgi:regulator of cell morphogenesis and NO signaling|uniref:iron-sulfur cluster repair di-iron protein n=1 Tax=Parachryseolinea silvisoli TaxID=2873601 RepID=UPI002265C7B7|nr:iron-sulfur cluster repair di-iron protein [Parachryseolinea silvisoli]MCD9018783.1 iron-sulfur cluster repair di-iron protein [Parachryseolinea silvisoli]